MRKVTSDHFYGKNSKSEFDLTEKDVDNFIKQSNENTIPVFSEHDMSKPIGKVVQIKKETNPNMRLIVTEKEISLIKGTGVNSKMIIDIEIDSSTPIGNEVLTNIENNSKIQGQKEK
jgi:hypothetical protein